jgi:hypothetical protein
MSDILQANLNVFNSAMGKAEFKEKLGRVIQYGARMVSGILTDADLQSPSAERKELIAKVPFSTSSNIQFI